MVILVIYRKQQKEKICSLIVEKKDARDNWNEQWTEKISDKECV